jgi:DNA-binding protein HU-beta
MSITSDLRGYADIAREQGKQAFGQAQSQFVEASDTAKQNVTDIAAKATETVGELRAQAEKAVNLEAIKSAIEPYLAQAKGYSNSVTDRAESLASTITSDPRLGRLVSTAEALTGVVVDTVNERLVKPVHALTGFGKPLTKPSVVRKPSVSTSAAKPATAKTTTGTAKATSATKTAATKTATSRSTAKPAAKSTPKATATKATARKAPATKAAPKS